MFLLSFMVRVLSIIETLLCNNVIYKVICNFVYKIKNKLLVYTTP